MVSVVEPATATRTKGRILVVDDELVVRDSLGKWFTSEGYTARPAGGAREALEIIQQAEFDIALLDIKMPGMDGMELQARLKEADPDLTIIIMTGYASVETAVSSQKAKSRIMVSSSCIPIIAAQGRCWIGGSAGRKPPRRPPSGWRGSLRRRLASSRP